MTTARSRTFEWGDPLRAAQEGLRLSGLEALRAIKQGQISIPPMAALMDMEPGDGEEGRVSVHVVPQEFHYANTGTVHGGLAATLLDSVMYLAIHSTLPAGVYASTIEIKVNYVRPITMDTGRVTGVGEVVHRGRRLATAEGRVEDADGKLLAHGTTSCMVIQPD
jgi:uncharacterized protein (TIGR00369 family)